jgi:hypothetical protein
LHLKDKESLDVWVDGAKMQTDAVFGDEGTEINFPIDPSDETVPQAQIRTISSGNVREGIVYCLIIDGQEIPELFNTN